MPLASDAASRLGALLDASADIVRAERERLVPELKPDGSIVTNADRAVERFLRGELPALAPGAAIWGEEEGYEAPADGGLWLVDPIDGTSNFRFGSPLWGISVALMREGRILLGGIALPDLGELFLAEAGAGATRNGAPLPPIPPGPVGPAELIDCPESVVAEFGRKDLAGKPRITGSFVVACAFVATQRFRGMICRGESLYDAAAGIVLNRELGGDVRFADGSPFAEAEFDRPRRIDPMWLMFPAESGFSR